MIRIVSIWRNHVSIQNAFIKPILEGFLTTVNIVYTTQLSYLSSKISIYFSIKVNLCKSQSPSMSQDKNAINCSAIKESKRGKLWAYSQIHLNLRNVSFQVNGCHFSTLNTNNKKEYSKGHTKSRTFQNRWCRKVETTCTLL